MEHPALTGVMEIGWWSSKRLRALGGGNGRNESPEAGCSRLCATNLAPDLFGWCRSTR